MSNKPDLKKEILDLADYLSCNGEELWSEIEPLFISWAKSREDEARIDELYQLSKTIINKQYTARQIKHVISSRCKWVSENGKVHIGITDIDKTLNNLEGKK